MAKDAKTNILAMQQELQSQLSQQQETVQQETAWKQNTTLQFAVNGAVFRIVDFEEEMTALQDEDITVLVGDVLPAIAALDDNSDTAIISAFSLLIDNISNKALLRRVIALLFLPVNNRVYNRQDVDARVEMLANVPNKTYLPLMDGLKDFFVFVGTKFPNVFATFTAMKK